MHKQLAAIDFNYRRGRAVATTVDVNQGTVICFKKNDIRYFFYCFSSHEIHRLYRQFLYSRETLHKYFHCVSRFRWERKFSKRTQQWCAVKVVKPKTYGYIPDLIKKYLKERKLTGTCQ